MWELKVNIPPHLKKGSVYCMDDDTGMVYMVENGKIAEYPLRQGISGYLWFLRLYERKYLKPLEVNHEKRSY